MSPYELASQVRVRRRTMHFPITNLISFRQSRGIVLVMAAPTREMDSAAVDSKIQEKICEILGISALKGYQVERHWEVYASRNVTYWCLCPLEAENPPVSLVVEGSWL